MWLPIICEIFIVKIVAAEHVTHCLSFYSDLSFRYSLFYGSFLVFFIVMYVFHLKLILVAVML